MHHSGVTQQIHVVTTKLLDQRYGAIIFCVALNSCDTALNIEMNIEMNIKMNIELADMGTMWREGRCSCGRGWYRWNSMWCWEISS